MKKQKKIYAPYRPPTTGARRNLTNDERAMLNAIFNKKEPNNMNSNSNNNNNNSNNNKPPAYNNMNSNSNNKPIFKRKNIPEPVNTIPVGELSGNEIKKFEILGINMGNRETISKREVTQFFRAKARKFHSNKNPIKKNDSENVKKAKINKAKQFQTMSNARNYINQQIFNTTVPVSELRRVNIKQFEILGLNLQNRNSITKSEVTRFFKNVPNKNEKKFQAMNNIMNSIFT